MYKVIGWTKYSVKDHYVKGRIGAPLSDAGRHEFKAETIPDIILQLKGFVSCTNNDDILLNSCDEPGRVDIQVYEDQNTYIAETRQIEEWKLGNCILWLSTYTFRIVEIKKVDLSNVSEIKAMMDLMERSKE